MFFFMRNPEEKEEENMSANQGLFGESVGDGRKERVMGG
jgi:hypothetical protein